MTDAVLERGQQTQAESSDVSLLEQAVQVTKQTDTTEIEQLLKTLADTALDGVVTWDKSLLKSVNQAINAIDAQLSQQLNEILHHEKLTQLEGSWRGLHYLTKNTETSVSLKIRVLNVTKRELVKDFTKASEFDQSILFKKIYEGEFGTPGGEPYGTLIGDFEFANSVEDLDLLSGVAAVASSAFCPFIASADPKLFGFEQWSDLSRPRDLAKIFDSVEYAKWRSFRETEDSRFVTLTLPRVLARLPYGAATQPVEAFNYEETPKDARGNPSQMANTDYCWMNASYVLGTKLTQSFAMYNWCTAIRGAEGGGCVNDLPMYTFCSDDGDVDAQCPTEIGITDRREAELGKLGFLPLCHYKNTDYAVFFGAQSTQKATAYDSPEANANAAISTRLPYIMATSRFAHYLKVMGRDKIGSFMEMRDVQNWLNNWIVQYVNDDPESAPHTKAKFPLAAASVQVKEVPGKPGAYKAVAWLKPWLQFEELTSSMRLVANIPGEKK